MYKVLDCVATQHDLRLVAWAAAICALSSYTTISLLHHVRRSGAHMWWVWLAVATTSTGFGIWATHFIAMLAFSPGVATAYNIQLTVLSLVIAVIITGLGLTIAMLPPWGRSSWLGGAIVGAGIAAMHYTGMAAFEVPGRNFLGRLVSGRIDRDRRAPRLRRTVCRSARRGSPMDPNGSPLAHRSDLRPPLHRHGGRFGQP